jgi:hypothetical protein
MFLLLCFRCCPETFIPASHCGSVLLSRGTLRGIGSVRQKESLFEGACYAPVSTIYRASVYPHRGEHAEQFGCKPCRKCKVEQDRPAKWVDTQLVCECICRAPSGSGVTFGEWRLFQNCSKTLSKCTLRAYFEREADSAKLLKTLERQSQGRNLRNGVCEAGAFSPAHAAVIGRRSENIPTVTRMSR